MLTNPLQLPPPHLQPTKTHNLLVLSPPPPSPTQKEGHNLLASRVNLWPPAQKKKTKGINSECLPKIILTSQHIQFIIKSPPHTLTAPPLPQF